MITMVLSSIFGPVLLIVSFTGSPRLWDPYPSDTSSIWRASAGGCVHSPAGLSCLFWFGLSTSGHIFIKGQCFLTNQFGSSPYRRRYTRETLAQDQHRIDIYERQYVGRVFLYILCGILDAVWQTTSYWIMGAMSNDPAKLAYYSGFCELNYAYYWVTWAYYSQTSLFNRLELQACGAQMP